MIAAELNNILPLLIKLKIKGNSSDSVATIVSIRKRVNIVWNLITSGDDALALFLSAVDKLMTGNFWKEFSGDMINLMESIIEKYVNSNLDQSIDEVSKLISLSKQNILPQITDDDK